MPHNDPKKVLAPFARETPGKKRADRAADMVFRELVLLLRNQVSDPRLRQVVFQHVEMTDDLKIARVFYALAPEVTREEREQAARALLKAKGFFRSHLAKVINMRYTPEIQFMYDDTVDRAHRLDEIFQGLHSDDF